MAIQGSVRIGSAFAFDLGMGGDELVVKIDFEIDLGGGPDSGFF